jgi:hypothetical protein
MRAMEPPAAPAGPQAGDLVSRPWCGSGQVDGAGEAGPAEMTSQWACTACSSPFERIRRQGRP